VKKKIGLLFSAPPGNHGVLNYHLSLLAAVIALPEDKYEYVVVYQDDSWLDFFRDVGSHAIKLTTGFWDHVLTGVRRRSHLPIDWWRRICPYIHPFTRELLAQRCDLWISPSQESWAPLIPLPILRTIYDLMHRYERRFPEVSANGEYEAREILFSNICRYSSGLLVDAEVGKQQVVESFGVNPDKVHVLPYIPPKHVYSIMQKDGFEARYSLPKKFIFYPANFWSHKNHQNLLHAIASLKGKLLDLNVVFVGAAENGYLATCELIEFLGLQERVHIFGLVPDADIPDFYRRARALVMPTFLGPTNIPPLEAMALGCPAAVSAVYGMPDQLENAALYFHPDSIEEIAQAIELLWTDDALCEELSRHGLDRSAGWNQSHFNVRLQEIIDRALSSLTFGNAQVTC